MMPWPHHYKIREKPIGIHQKGTSQSMPLKFAVHIPQDLHYTWSQTLSWSAAVHIPQDLHYTPRRCHGLLQFTYPRISTTHDLLQDLHYTWSQTLSWSAAVHIPQDLHYTWSQTLSWSAAVHIPQDLHYTWSQTLSWSAAVRSSHTHLQATASSSYSSSYSGKLRT